MDGPAITWKRRAGRKPYAQTRINGRTYHLGSDRTQLKRLYAQAMVEAYGGAPIKSAPLFVAQLVEAWLRERPDELYPEALKTWARFGGRTLLAAITPDHFDAYLAWLKRGYSVKPSKHKRGSTPARSAKSYAPSSIRRRVQLARKLCQWAVDRGWMHLVPRMPRLPAHMPRARDVDPESLRRAFDQLPDRAGLLLRFILETGCRPAEARMLKWSDVDRAGKCVVLSEHKTGLRSGRQRVIVLTDAALELLATVPQRDGHLVFPSRLGQPYTASGLRAILRRAAPGITPYQLRHSFAQHAIDSGVAVDDLAGLLGHLDVRTTRHYAEIRATRLHRVAEGLTSPLPNQLPDNQPVADGRASGPSASKAPRGRSDKHRSRRSAG